MTTKATKKPQVEIPLRPYGDVEMSRQRRQALDLVIDNNGFTTRELARESGYFIPIPSMHEALRWLEGATMVETGKKRRCTAGRQKDVLTWWLVPWGDWPKQRKDEVTEWRAKK